MRAATMANAGLNIHSMVNKGRGQMDYALVAAESAVGDEVPASLRAVYGLLAVRYQPAPTELK